MDPRDFCLRELRTQKFLSISINFAISTNSVSFRFLCSLPPQKSTGILLVLNNYTGDRLNFGIAIERAHLLGYNVDMLLAVDDCAFHEPTDADRALENLQIDESVIPKSKLNTRGLAGVYFMIRLANAMAKQGLDLKELKTRLRNYSELITTYSVSLNSCDIPGVGRSFNIGNLQMELGLGMHGELGAKR